MPLTIVDTDVLIDAGRGISDAINTLTKLEVTSTLAISIVTQMELTVGCRNKSEQQALERFLRRFQILGITTGVSSRAVDLLNNYYLSHGLLIADALIAATAIELGEPFITKNQRDFRFLNDLNLLAYPA